MKKLVLGVGCVMLGLALTNTGYSSSTALVYADETKALVLGAPYESNKKWTTDWVKVMPKYGQSLTLDEGETRTLYVQCKSQNKTLFKPKELTITCTSGAVNCTLSSDATRAILKCKNTNSDDTCISWECGGKNPDDDERLNIQIAECDKELANGGNLTTSYIDNSHNCT